MPNRQTLPTSDSVANARAAQRWYWLAAAVVVLDQLTKWAVVATFSRGEVLPITGWFNLLLTYNEGAAFSFLAGAGGWQRWALSGLAIVLSAVLVVWIARAASRWVEALPLALILGGALGNVIDRLRIGAVVDFLDLHYGGYHWPAFNVADMAISAGALIILVALFFDKESRQRRGGRS